MHYEYLPADSPHAPLRHAAVRPTTGKPAAVFEDESDARVWIEEKDDPWTPTAGERGAMSDLDIREGV